MKLINNLKPKKMKVELKKVNQADGDYWYGIWVNGSCEIPSYGHDYVKAKEAYDKIIEAQKKPKPPYEVMESIEI
jgi:hypothetical protein